MRYKLIRDSVTSFRKWCQLPTTNIKRNATEARAVQLGQCQQKTLFKQSFSAALSSPAQTTSGHRAHTSDRTNVQGPANSLSLFEDLDHWGAPWVSLLPPVSLQWASCHQKSEITTKRRAVRTNRDYNIKLYNCGCICLWPKCDRDPCSDCSAGSVTAKHSLDWSSAEHPHNPGRLSNSPNTKLDCTHTFMWSRHSFPLWAEILSRRTHLIPKPYLDDLSNFTFWFQLVQFQVCCPHVFVTSEKGSVPKKWRGKDCQNIEKNPRGHHYLLHPHIQRGLVRTCSWNPAHHSARGKPLKTRLQGTR